MKQLIRYSAFTVALGVSLFAADGKTLFEQKCAFCHMTTKPTPQQRSQMVAPPAAGVMFHVKDRYPNKADAVNFIVDYAHNPSKEKALCPSIRRFGLMPSQKGAVTKDELKAIASYMFDTFPPSGFKHPKGMGMGMGMPLQR
ncbi:c-type cytochrome [Hydrogenimonas thermophila]|uniref:Cytochrome C oxidase, cbb3-type, subunit III n=1 Tax=Hydrogenimonas thermophila TaxID=223786 RepID=A0A1I5NAW2_9BACT|nr:cytochrome c [Hydrogenimonas thermophila]WOE69161.1 c-type cytochrome [Hydrogenimonas thermophila]WOE71671.1 c-type cytochrome [Hydrogenimonas thermophila]SFP18899.1 Cytochrome C oxidase, cbb3-type, subunit III [Hydrogenimonas thermophila]